MKRSGKVIISCAVTGSIHTPSMSPHLPITPHQIADAAVGAAQAGAAMVHLHARDPETGKATQNPEVFARFLPDIKQRSDAIINIAAGGGWGMTLDERLAPALWAKPEIASMNMGSLNFNISGAAGRIADCQYAWEKRYRCHWCRMHPIACAPGTAPNVGTLQWKEHHGRHSITECESQTQ